MTQLEITHYDLAIDKSGFRRLVAESSLVREFWLSQPSSLRGIEELDQLWKRLDIIFKRASQKVHINIFETDSNADSLDDVLWVLNQSEIPQDPPFEDKIPVFAYLSWYKDRGVLQNEEIYQIYLSVAIDVRSDNGRRYFDNLMLLIKSPTKGSRFIINLELGVPKYFRKADGRLRDLNEISHFPCKSLSVQTNLFSES
jgi:hypothetical protein